jgi:hypothetical protein
MNDERAESAASDRIWLDAVFLSSWLVLGVVASVGLVFVIPKYAQIFTQLDVELPVSTRLVLRTSMFFVSWWFVIFPVVLLVSIVPLFVAPGRSWPLYLVGGLALLLLMVAGFFSVYGPMVKIQQMLGKNKGGPPPAAASPAESPPPGGR